VNGARAAQAAAAAELRPAQIEHVAQDPEERHVGDDVDGVRSSVYEQVDGGHMRSIRRRPRFGPVETPIRG